MLDTNIFVRHGTIFLKLDGTINNNTIDSFECVLKYLLNNIGVKNFVIDFLSVELDEKVIPSINDMLLNAYSFCERLELKGLVLC